MFEGNALVFQHLQHLAAKADLAVHHILLDADDAVSLMPGNAGNRGDSHLMRSVFADHGAGMVRLVGVPYIGRDTGPVHREHGVLMQYGSAHMAQFPQFLVSD